MTNFLNETELTSTEKQVKEWLESGKELTAAEKQLAARVLKIEERVSSAVGLAAPLPLLRSFASGEHFEVGYHNGVWSFEYKHGENAGACELTTSDMIAMLHWLEKSEWEAKPYA